MINSQNAKEADSHKGTLGTLQRASGGLRGSGGSENVQDVFQADKSFCQIEDICSDMSGSQRHFLEACATAMFKA